MKYLLLAVALVSWCAIHSATISGPVADRLQRRMGAAARYYRILYNLVAIATFLPVVMYMGMVRTEPLFAWTGGMRVIQFALLGTALTFLLLGALRYDLRQFLGLSQLGGSTSGRGIATGGGLDTTGILGVVRHPMYFATGLLIWARPLDASAILVNAILTAYLIVGTRLEERKLVEEFGDEYRIYRKTVPMLLPYKLPGHLFRPVPPDGGGKTAGRDDKRQF